MTISEAISRMIEIKAQKNDLTNEYNKLQAIIQKKGTSDLSDVKIKSVSYYSKDGDKATITLADSVKINSVEILKSIFGIVYPSMVEEKITYTLKAPAKRILSAIWHKEYYKSNVGDIIKSLDCDDKSKKLLARKLKGIDFEKDKENLINIAGLSETEASDTAFYINEAMAWENMCTFIKVNNNGEINDDILDDVILKVNAAVAVERELKTTLKGTNADEL